MAETVYGLIMDNTLANLKLATELLRVEQSKLSDEPRRGFDSHYLLALEATEALEQIISDLEEDADD